MQFRSRFFFFVFLCCWANGAWAGSVWSTWQGNASHTGYVPSVLSPGDFHQIWSKTIPRTNEQLFSAGGGLVFDYRRTRYDPPQELHAYDARTGVEVWHKEVEDKPSSSAPAYANGVVYWTVSGTPGDPAKMYAIDAATGVELFATPFGSQGSTYGIPTPYASKLYGNSGYFSGIRAFDGTKAQIDWSVTIDGQYGWSPAVDESHVYLYYGRGGAPGPGYGVFYAFDRLTGAIDYTIANHESDNPTSDNYASPLLGSLHDAFLLDANAYNFDNPLQLIRFDLDARDISWRIDGNFAEGMALREQKLFVVNFGNLEVRDELTGNLLWSWPASSADPIISNVIVTDSHAFVSTSQRTFAIDLNTHASAWQLGVGGRRLVMADNNLYIKGLDSKLGSTEHLVAISVAVPEPGTWLLALVGSVGIGAVVRRARRRK